MQNFLLLLFLAIVASFSAAGQNASFVPVQGAGELLSAGEVAFNHGDWQGAASHFQEFLKDYGGLDGTANTLARVKPLLAICQVRLGRFEEALPLLEEALKQPELEPKQRVDLVFFAGLSNLRMGNADAARKQLGEIFTDAKVERGRRMDALILGGMSYVMEKKWKEAIVFFGTHAEEIKAYSPEAGARARILLLHSLMEERRWDEATLLAREIHSALHEARQVATFSSLLIAIGSHYLEEGGYHRAISVLRLVPTAAEVRSLQNSRLAEAEQELKSATAGGNSVRASQIQSAVEEMRRELEAFEKIPQFDSATRLRMAGAYFHLERTREACLILDQMVRQMVPDAMVEEATASLIRGWMALNRYPRAVRTADLYLERFEQLAEKPNFPDVLFLKAQALEGQFQYLAASEAYREVSIRFPKSAIAAKADFMAAYNILQLEDYKQAGALLDRQLKKMGRGDEMWQHVFFWRAMAFYFDQRWEDARKGLEDYLEASKKEGVGNDYVDDSSFRIGYSYFSEAKYAESIKTLAGFASSHPSSEWLGEALLTLGDAYAAEGELENADRSYSQIGVEWTGFHDEGWMKRGNLLKIQKDLSAMKKLFIQFLEKRSDSPRIAEGLQWLGWIAKKEGNIAEARQIYWNAIERFGNDNVRPGLEEIFMELITFYSGADLLDLRSRLEDALEKARMMKKSRLVTRLGWALAQLHLANKNVALEVRNRESREALVSLAAQIDPKETAPRILADTADSLVENRDFAKAAVIYDGLRKWWPRAPERDRAYAGLGMMAVRAGKKTEALVNFEKYEKSAMMPKTAPNDRGISLVEGELGGQVALAKAGLLAKADPEKALNILLAIQKTKSMPANVRAEAFMEAARWQVKWGKHRDALPYFEQVYLLFNRFPSMVADAYYERGEALEKLGMPEKAREVYSELASRQDLAGFERSKLGLQRAVTLGGVIEPKNPEGELNPPTPVLR